MEGSRGARVQKWLCLARMRQEREQYDKALRDYERAFRLDPILLLSGRLPDYANSAIRTKLIKNLEAKGLEDLYCSIELFLGNQ